MDLGAIAKEVFGKSELENLIQEKVNELLDLVITEVVADIVDRETRNIENIVKSKIENDQMFDGIIKEVIDGEINNIRDTINEGVKYNLETRISGILNSD